MDVEVVLDGSQCGPSSRHTRHNQHKLKSDRMRHARRAEWLLLLPAFLLLCLCFLVPSLDVILTGFFDPGFTTRHFERLLATPVYLQVLANTIQVSLIVSGLAVVFGYPMAYFLHGQPPGIRFRLMLLVFIPLWMSMLIRSFSWMILLGRDGVINEVLIAGSIIDSPMRMLYTTGAVYVAMLQILLPIQVVASYSSMSEIDPALIRAARVAGASSFGAFRRIFLPLSLDGTIGGMSIVFMLSMGFFITPALVGGRQDMMLGNLIMQQIEQLNWGFAAAIATFMLVSTLCIVAIMRWAGGRLARMLP